MATSDSPLSVPDITLAVARQAGGNPPSGDWTEGQPPVIQSVSGSFTEGQQATITVSNLSTKRNGQVYFENFETAALNESVANFGYIDSSDVGYFASNDAPLFGSRFMRAEALPGRLGGRRYVFGALDEIFFEGWCRIDRVDFTSSQGTPQIKTWRLATEGADYNDTFYFGGTQDTGPYASKGTGVADNWYGNFTTTNVWDRTSMYWKRSSAPNVADGKRYYKNSTSERFTWSSFPGGHFASPAGVVADDEWDGEEIITDDGTASVPMGQIALPFYTRSDQSTIVDCDRVFVNDSQERVMVGDAATWKACDNFKAFILPQVSRANGEIVVDVDALGPLATGPVYLYVCNQDGLYNEVGYEWRAS